jgi:hypothetical protein
VRFAFALRCAPAFKIHGFKKSEMGDKGPELSANIPDKHEVSKQRGTESGTLLTNDDKDLAKIVSAWPGLTQSQRTAILGIALASRV